ncbi:MAG: 2-hydroxychromene-2-carboxylate isomerase [Pseudomonadota bacterium]
MANHIEIEFFYDCSSPWTYFAFTRMVPLCEELGLVVRWRPFLVGGVFNAVNQQVYKTREALFSDPDNKRKLSYFIKDLNNWAELCGVTVEWPSAHPISAVKAMRGAFLAEEQGLIVPYSRAVFEAYWGGVNPDIASDEVLQDICSQVDLDTEGFFEAINQQAYKDLLRQNTDEVIARGGFGSPTIFINQDDMYFGNDRLPLVEHRLRDLLTQ